MKIRKKKYFYFRDIPELQEPASGDDHQRREIIVF
jgi:hypothetical protein